MHEHPDPVREAYRRIRPMLGEFAATVDLTDRTFPGTYLTDRDWLADRVTDTGARWGCDDPRVNGTLWWYSASSTLVAAPLAMLLTDGVAPDPDPAALRCSLRDNGYLAAARSAALLPGVAAYAAALAAAHAATITALAAVSGAAPRALWAVATDSLANRALTAGRAVEQAAGQAAEPPAGRVEEACALAAQLAVPPLVPPRYVDVAEAGRVERFVRRTSCCLIYLATGGDKCRSCPRRTPDARAEQLRRHVARA